MAKAATSRIFWRLPWLCGAHLLVRHELEAVDQLVAVGLVDWPWTEPRNRSTSAPVSPATGSPRSARRRAGGGSPARRAARRDRRCGPGRRSGAIEAEQHGDGGRLAGAVRTEVAEHLSRLDLQVQAVERHGVPVALGQPLGAHRGGHRGEATSETGGLKARISRVDPQVSTTEPDAGPNMVDGIRAGSGGDRSLGGVAMTDPYVVRCPACLAEPGERCTNRIRPLESVHWSRHRLARQRRSRQPVTASTQPAASAEALRPLATVRGGRGRSG